MALTSMGAHGFDDNVYEPQRVNNILLYITGLDSDAGGGDAMAEDAVLVLALDSAPIPKRSVGIIEAAHLNEKRKFAGNPVYEDVSIVYKNFCTAETTIALEAWWESVSDADAGTIGYVTDYKKNGYCIAYDSKGEPMDQWNLYGIWPTNFDPGDADMAGEDIVRINMTLAVDKVKRADAAGTILSNWPSDLPNP
jgi:hypothetical protein